MWNSVSRYDKEGYGKDWLSKSDLTPKSLRKYGIYATQKEINSVYKKSYLGSTLTKGVDYYNQVHVRHVGMFSIARLRDLLKR